MNNELFITKLYNNKLIDEANNLGNSGILLKNGSYSFLKIEDDFIHKLYPMLQQDKVIKKPDYFSGTKQAGAHITLIYEEENVTLDVSDIGQVHNFTIKELCSAILDNKEYFVLMVTSPSLDALRFKYIVV